MGDPIKKRLSGHALSYGGKAVYRHYPDEAVCQCGVRSPLLAYASERKRWHQQHKADVLDTWVHNGCDDRGKEVHL